VNVGPRAAGFEALFRFFRVLRREAAKDEVETLHGQVVGAHLMAMNQPLSTSADRSTSGSHDRFAWTDTFLYEERRSNMISTFPHLVRKW
jgi:hypothetical protein